MKRLIFSATLCLSSAYAGAIVSTSASTFAGAQNVNGSFTLNALANVTDSTTIPHVEISQNGRTGAGFDFYRFSHNGGTVHVDGDSPTTADFEVGIWTAGGTLVASNDDNGFDAGDAFILNPAVFGLNLAAGDYVVGMCRFNCNFQSGSPYMTGSTLLNGDRYTLNISANAVPEPLSMGLTGIGLALVTGLKLRRRR